MAQGSCSSKSSLLLKRACAVCATTEALSLCSRCHVVAYCGAEHQRKDFETHKAPCKAVKSALKTCAKEEQILHDWPEDGFPMQGDPFEKHVGLFWGYNATRDYMRARCAVANTMIRFIGTYDAVETALGHYLDMLRLCRGDNMGVRDVIPSLLLRLGRSQDAYDFIKWWATVPDSYDWGDVSLPYLDLAGADVFESVDYMCGRIPNAQDTIDLTLIKIRLALDLGELIQAEDDGDAVPACRSAVSLAVPATERANRLEVLGPQIARLVSAMHAANKHMWKGFFVDTKAHRTAMPPDSSSGSVSEMQLVVQKGYPAWDETPGALDYLRAAVEELGISVM
ncbi:hypothetical protein HDU89_003628 [Geranomyces variabilis]|nr:hypothetical protein HDU89_003628 [Geranomyces variabilis]